MKKLVIFIVAILSCIAVRAQSKHVVYQGDVETGYSLGIADGFDMDRFLLHTCHGVKIGEHFGVGVGAGIEYYFQSGNDFVTVPVFARVKKSWDVSKRNVFFVLADTGCAFADGGNDFLLSPMIGISHKILKNQALNFSFGCDVTTFALTFRVGCQF
ncbi:MAG: hypothetical protein PHW85_06115 [Bacteroidales bacterium]|nr:hypothetical protein [Bacteroidales bacterium]